MGTGEDGAGAADGLRDPGGQAVVVDPERLVVPLERPVEFCPSKKTLTFMGSSRANHTWIMKDDTGSSSSLLYLLFPAPSRTTFECPKGTRQRSPMQVGYWMTWSAYLDCRRWLPPQWLCQSVTGRAAREREARCVV